jgi:DNA polymerase-3 subunit epsilon
VHVHGITPEAVHDAPRFVDVAPRIRLVLEGAVLVAHGAKYDVAFLEAESRRAGDPLTIPFYLDTLTLARRAFGFKSHALAALVQALGLPSARAHRADDDVDALRRIFARVVVELRATSPRDLWHVEIARRHARPSIVEALEVARKAATPVQVRYRPSGKPPVDLLLVVTQMRTELDPPRVIGYLLPGRGRRELRADRILTVEPPRDP